MYILSKFENTSIRPTKGGTIMTNAKFSTGEKPGKGCYTCTNCGFDLRLGSDDKMPPCPNCNNTTFVKNN